LDILFEKSKSRTKPVDLGDDDGECTHWVSIRQATRNGTTMNPALDPNLLKGHLDLILLTILEHGEMYGLQIIGEASKATGGYFRFKEGSVYPALNRLTQAGFLICESRESDLGGPKRKYLKLSELGKTTLATKRTEWDSFIQAIDRLRYDRRNEGRDLL
jgi:PadR family transcriptional regulator, regulatory protein PadR